MLLRAGDLVLERFEPGFSEIAYEIRNHESVRAHMRDTNPISRASHDAWVKENLLDAVRLHLFIVRSAHEPVGLALLRNFEGDTAEIGLMVKDARRRPLACYKAAHLIGYYGFEILGLGRIWSYVPRHNTRALKFNLASGFEQSEERSSAVYCALGLSAARSRLHPTHRRFRASYSIVIAQKAFPSATC
jgi:RimJ/RimL family protein N-acetyltransferase